jgi:TonB family protein
MRPTILAASLLVFSWFLTSLARADQVEQQLKSDYLGKTLTLRQFFTAERLQFAPDGRILSNPATGPWTLYSQVAIEKIRLEHGSLALTGRRVQIKFESGKQVDELSSIENNSDKFSKDLAKELRKLKVEIEIQLPGGQPDEKQIDSAIHHVFLTDSESFPDFVPGYWKSCLLRLAQQQPGQQPNQSPNVTDAPTAPDPPGSYDSDEHVYKVGGRAVKPPRATYMPDPPFSEEARRAKFQGTLVLWLVVSSEGVVRNLRIARPLGLGLDEKAVEAVRQWRFNPGTKDGEPVATMVNVEVTFHLY